ncbi:MAG TPA: hypothetical protein VHP31_08505 [Caproicibacter sp.]|nr:hypothetical protein [Caproicibacter sp.]
MELSFNGFGENAATFSAQDGVAAGAPVKMTGNGTVGVCAAGDNFCGVALNTRGGYAAVQLRGYVQLPYDGTAPAVGWQALSASAGGKIQTAATGGRTILVVDVDDTAKICGVIL